MYTDRCLLDKTNVPGVMELADRFVIQSLVERCEEFLIYTFNSTLVTHPSKEVMETVHLSKVYNSSLISILLLEVLYRTIGSFQSNFV
jgi:hypothetical protein